MVPTRKHDAHGNPKSKPSMISCNQGIGGVDYSDQISATCHQSL